MTVRISTKLMNFIAAHGSYKRALTNGELQFWSGAQPASANSAMTGTKLLVVTASSGARTPEVLSRGQVALTGGASGQVTQIAVNSVNLLAAAVPYNTSLAQTAADVAAAINSYETTPDYVAIASGANIIIQAMPGTGTEPNGYTVVSTVSTITSTDTNMGTTAAGVAAVNGLQFGAASAGVISKSGTWSGVGLASGTAASFRFIGSIADANGDDSTNLAQIRFDGSCGLAGSGADMIMGTTTITAGATTTVDSGGITVPAS